ncbi:hypothetical protein GQX73_g697 [Xylaria multiplex]|uniref:Uncharacterized protein n=1 Tax=Xylaria multiplex TaxID=323545 RepID=A0A7C8IX12_9PEZI|nr:hypothetical protein GQX73_g697 [Xylaria multiplex]
MVGEHAGSLFKSLFPKAFHHFKVLTNAQLRRNIATKEEFIRCGIDKTISRFKGHGERSVRSAMDSLLLKESDLATSERRKPDFHSREIYDELFGFFVAGYDTSTCAFSWLVKDIAENQRAQTKLRSALRDVFSSASAESRQPSATEISGASIPYLDAAIEETLRLHSPIGAQIREAIVDTDLLGQNTQRNERIQHKDWQALLSNTSRDYQIPILIGTGPDFLSPSIPVPDSIRSNTSEKRYEYGSWDPEDMHLFNPERWIKVDEEGTEIYDHQAGPFLSFGLGPRGCSGRQLAYLELRIVLVLLIWNFKFHRVTGEIGSYASVDKMTTNPKFCYVHLSRCTLTLRFLKLLELHTALVHPEPNADQLLAIQSALKDKASGDTLDKEPTPIQTKATHISYSRPIASGQMSAFLLPTAGKWAESELRESKQNEWNERQTRAAADIINRLEGTSTKKEKAYFPIGTTVVSFDELWQCKYSNTFGACQWTGRFQELIAHFATFHHIFQDAGPDAKWTVCLVCNTPSRGWERPSECSAKACFTYLSWQRWYWGSLVKNVETPGEHIGSTRSLEKRPLLEPAERKEESMASYADAVKDQTHKTSAHLTQSPSQYASEDVNSQPETWTTNLTRPPSGVHPSSASDPTKSTNKSDATPHTSVPSSFSYSYPQKSKGSALLGIQEEEAHTIKDDPAQGALTEELPDLIDDASVISRGSTEYSPHQKDDAILRFTRAMLERLPENLNYVVVNETSRQRLLHHLRLALKEFALAVEAMSNNNTHRRGIRMVRRLRQEIANKVHDEILKINQATESSHGLRLFPGNLPPITLQEKVRGWTVGINLPFTMGSQNLHIYQDLVEATPNINPSRRSSPTNSSVAIELGVPEVASLLQAHLMHSSPVNLYGNSVDPAEVTEYFTEQSAFSSLIDETERLFARYHGQKMDLIRQRTSLALRRHPEASRKFSAVFSVNWALADFLVNNYDAGVSQKLNRILAITGGSETAIMCPVGEYMTWCWPSYGTQLLHVIESVLCSSNGGQTSNRIEMPGATRDKEPGGDENANNPPLDVPISQYIAADSTLRRFEVEGTEDFVISIAQQLSWLAAVCQEKSNTYKHAYIGFLQVPGLSTVEFEIDITLEPPSALESGSCWNEVVGPAVVVNGFPLPERGPEDQGLEVSVSVMASLAGLPQAVTFGGGFVFKGNYHALVPVRNSSESTQWHLVNTYPKRLRWADVDKSCPGRLRGETDGDAFLQKRSFLGWCPLVVELLGTAEYDYESVQYSKAKTCGRRPQLNKVTVGFSQWAQITGEFTLSKKDGFRRPNELDDYEMLLDDAKSMHVILHDTAHRRAYQTNVEELILHIIHHRKKLYLSRKMSDLEFADANRRAKTIRQVMHNNSEKVLHALSQISSSVLRECRFKEEVKLLYSILDALWANTYESEDKSLKMGLPFKLTTSTSGWEYMEVVRNHKHMSPKTVDLRKTCGRWNDYAKDIQALILFGANLGDILKPASGLSIKASFSDTPDHQPPPKALSVKVTKAIVRPEDLLSVKPPHTSGDYEYITESSTASDRQWSGSLSKPTSNTTSTSISYSTSGLSKITRDLATSTSNSNDSERINTDAKGKEPVRAISAVEPLGKREPVTAVLPSSPICLDPPAVNGNQTRIRVLEHGI